eukprot:jgi/Tetstr1/422885/TSEL_001297.t1
MVTICVDGRRAVGPGGRRHSFRRPAAWAAVRSSRLAAALPLLLLVRYCAAQLVPRIPATLSNLELGTLGSQGCVDSGDGAASSERWGRRLHAAVGAKSRGRPGKGLRITLGGEHAKLAPSRSKLRKISESLRRGEPLHVLREARPAKLPGGRRAGKVVGSPTAANYTFDEGIRAMCADRHQRIRIRKFPLSLPLDRDPQHMFVTKAMAQANFESDPKWEQHMAEIEKHLPLLSSDLFGGRRMYGSCAVVGNSGNLRRAEWGAEIDRHEAVFRFNRAPTAGYEKWVGRRTDFRILNNAESRIYAHGGRRNDGLQSIGAGLPVSYIRSQERKKKRWLNAPKEDCPLDHNSTIVLSRQQPNETAHFLQGIRMQTLVRKMAHVRLTMLDKFIFEYAKTALGEFRQCLAVRRGADPAKWGLFGTPSTGVLLTMGAIHLCQRVSVYGIGESTMKGSPYQYFKNQILGNFGSPNTQSHNFELERRWMHHLANEGLIRKCEYGACLEAGKPPPASPVGPDASGAKPSQRRDAIPRLRRK